MPLTVEQRLHIYDILCEVTGTSGAIRQAEFFVYRPSDRAALEGALARYRDGAPIEPTTWIRATAKDVALIGSLGVPVLASMAAYTLAPNRTPLNRLVYFFIVMGIAMPLNFFTLTKVM